MAPSVVQSPTFSPATPTQSVSPDQPAQHGSEAQVRFAAKYYGACPEIATTGDSPDLKDVMNIMARKTKRGEAQAVQLTFGEYGLEVMNRKNKNVEALWGTTALASCATTLCPGTKSRRLGLLKVVDPTGPIDQPNQVWHLFKYFANSGVDNMSDCFRFVVDSGLREIGRDCAQQMALFEQEPTPPPAWDEPVTSHHLSTAVICAASEIRRQLAFGEEEPADLEHHLHRLSLHSDVLDDEVGDFADFLSSVAE
eukprot:m.64229 g.64229  ORF g.64229 m.64229 type:complete len:253 (-) comp9706_c0_seq1:181-939(-)